jgi:hypothetical protein
MGRNYKPRKPEILKKQVLVSLKYCAEKGFSKPSLRFFMKVTVYIDD